MNVRDNNIKRMKYGSYIKNGYLIGSGSVESTHVSMQVNEFST